jgi:hypothetical protein
LSNISLQQLPFESFSSSSSKHSQLEIITTEFVHCR